MTTWTDPEANDMLWEWKHLVCHETFYRQQQAWDDMVTDSIQILIIKC